jgi:hypothetical protein
MQQQPLDADRATGQRVVEAPAASGLIGDQRMIVSIAAAALAAHLSMTPGSAAEPVLPQAVQYRVPAHPPPCGHGWDLSARDGLCYPNGYLHPQDQAARQYRRYHHGDGYYGDGYYGGGRYPVRCGHGADLDIRDGQCYPNGTVPPQFQAGRQRHYGGGYEGRRYYYQD